MVRTRARRALQPILNVYESLIEQGRVHWPLSTRKAPTGASSDSHKLFKRPRLNAKIPRPVEYCRRPGSILERGVAVFRGPAQKGRAMHAARFVISPRKGKKFAVPYVFDVKSDR